ncbi:MAG: hypothetical protein WDM76_07705 [Limisphaerales bacterium]
MQSGGFIEKNGLPATQKSPHFIMIAGHDEQEAIGPILKNQTNAQTGANLEIRRGKFADAQALMPV